MKWTAASPTRAFQMIVMSRLMGSLMSLLQGREMGSLMSLLRGRNGLIWRMLLGSFGAW